MILTDEQIFELAERLQWAADLTKEQFDTVKDNIDDYLRSIENESN